MSQSFVVAPDRLLAGRPCRCVENQFSSETLWKDWDFDELYPLLAQAEGVLLLCRPEARPTYKRGETSEGSCVTNGLDFIRRPPFRR
jgi:hypothetical protein